MTVLLALLHLLIGGMLGGVFCSGLTAVIAAVAGLLRGKVSFLLLLIWPVVIWYVVVPVSLFLIGLIADEWGHKTQVFMLVSFGLVALPGLFTAFLMGSMAGSDDK